MAVWTRPCLRLDVSGLEATVAAVDLLAHLQLRALRHGWRIRLCNGSPELVELIELSGLAGALRSQYRGLVPAPGDSAATPSPENPLRGSCLCGGVQFELTAPFLRAGYCHCSRCRKHSGAAALVQGRVPREGFRLLEGAELIETYRPAGGMAKAFCRVCGSSLFGGRWPEGSEVSVRFGCLDGDPAIRPQFHTYVESRAPWEQIPDDGLPRHPGQRPRG